MIHYVSDLLEMEVDARLIYSQQAALSKLTALHLRFPQIICVCGERPLLKAEWHERVREEGSDPAQQCVCGMQSGMLGIAVSTDYWLYLEEGVILPLNQSADIRMSIHSGLWRVCFLAGKYMADSLTSSYIYSYSFSRICDLPGLYA